MKAVALLLLLCMVAALVQQGEAWRRRWRFRPRIRVRPRIRLRKWTRPISKITRRVIFRRIISKVSRWRNIARKFRRKFRRFRSTFRRFRRVLRVRVRFNRIKKWGKKIGKSARRLKKNISRLAKNIKKIPYWMKSLVQKGQQCPGGEGPPEWLNDLYKQLESSLPQQPTKTGPACPTNGEKGDQSKFVSHGDVTKLSPTGAGTATKTKSGLKYSGVDLSKELVNKDFNAINKNITCILNIAYNNGIQPALVAAIASRDTGVGKHIAGQDGWDKRYQGYGIIKCNMRSSGLPGRGCFSHRWSKCDHMNMMIEHVFMPRLQQVRALKPSWSKDQQLQGAVAAMNYGVNGLKSWSNIDTGTTGGDYSNDVIARAQHLISCYQL